jgi:hypothetical protein
MGPRLRGDDSNRGCASDKTGNGVMPKIERL